MEVTVVGEPDSKKYKGNPTYQWSNLTPDLLSFINTKLRFADRIRFRSVCKDWHNIPIGDRPINELPWVMTHTDFCFFSVGAVSVNKLKVMLSDPVQKKTYPIPNFPGIVAKYLNYFGNSTICASKCGWVLLANCEKDLVVDLFLYSPFNNNVITLPTLYGLFRYCSLFPYYDLATFLSTNPTSPNCVFVVIRCRPVQSRLRISTYRYGDNEWRTKIFEDVDGRVASLVCTEMGVCYFVLECGKLGTFCVESQECTWLVDSVWIQRDKMHLVESNGDLLLAKCSFMYDHWKVFRYNVNERGWTEKKTLGDRALFVCSCSSYLRPAIGDTTDLGDTIVYHHYYGNESKIRVYSLKDGKGYKKSPAYDWMVNDSFYKVLIEPPY